MPRGDSQCVSYWLSRLSVLHPSELEFFCYPSRGPRMNKRSRLFVVALIFAGTTAGISLLIAQAPQPAPNPASPSAPQLPTGVPQHPVLSVIFLDPAHGGIDTGARGAGGIRESEVVLSFAGQIRSALERSGFRVVLTREGNDNPSFDERSAVANGQRGAVFITLHVASTGTPGTARVYSLALAQPAQTVSPSPSSQTSPQAASPVILPAPQPPDVPGILIWDRAQVPFLDLSQRLADITQVQLSQRFRGSPTLPLTAAVRQLRTVSAPAIAIELSSVSAEDNNTVTGMGPGLADGVVQAILAFRSYYESSPALPGGGGR